jgi:uncharacterized membrane protein YecN with MAPEG domain
MASSKVYRIPYDKETVQPLLGIATSQANPVYYIAIFLLLFIIILALHFRVSITTIVIILVGIPVYAAVVLYALDILKECSRRHIPEAGRTFFISRNKVVFHQPSYNPNKVQKVVLKRTEIKVIGLTFRSRKKVADMEFHLRDGTKMIFMAEMLDLGGHNLPLILKELGYPVEMGRPGE